MLGQRPKSFTAFGTRALAAFVSVEKVVMFDLTELKAGSVAMSSEALQSHQEGCRVHKTSTGVMVENVKRIIVEHVSPVDEEET